MPPTPLTLHILLALAAGEMGPQDIAAQIAGDTRSTLLVRNSGLYKALHRLELGGYIELGGGGRYRLTKRGRLALKRERVRVMAAASLLRTRG